MYEIKDGSLLEVEKVNLQQRLNQFQHEVSPLQASQPSLSLLQSISDTSPTHQPLAFCPRDQRWPRSSLELAAASPASLPGIGSGGARHRELLSPRVFDGLDWPASHPSGPHPVAEE